MISPGFNCCEHTLNTLRYADRVKELSSGGGSVGAMAAPKPPEILPPSELAKNEPSSPTQTDLQYLHLSLQNVSYQTVSGLPLK